MAALRWLKKLPLQDAFVFLWAANKVVDEMEGADTFLNSSLLVLLKSSQFVLVATGASLWDTLFSYVRFFIKVDVKRRP